MPTKTNNFILFILLELLLSCNFFTASEKDLTEKNTIFYYQNTKKPFNGITQDFDANEK